MSKGEPRTTEPVLDRIKEYLCLGGLFNPELMDPEAVRDLLIECRDTIIKLRKRVDNVHEALLDL